MNLDCSFHETLCSLCSLQIETTPNPCHLVLFPLSLCTVIAVEEYKKQDKCSILNSNQMEQALIVGNPLEKARVPQVHIQLIRCSECIVRYDFRYESFQIPRQ